MNPDATIKSDRAFRKNRLRMYLRYELREHNYIYYAAFVFLLNISVLLGIFTDDIILKLFILMMIISPGSGRIQNAHYSHYLWPLSDRFMAMFNITIRFVETYAGFLLLYLALNFGTWLMKGSDMPLGDFLYHFTPDNLSYIHWRFLAYGMIICWICVGLTGLGSAAYQIKGQVMLFMSIAIMGLYLLSTSHALVALILAVPVILGLTKFREAWLAGDLTKKMLWLMGLAGAGLLALGLLLPPFSEDLIGWNLLVACEVIFLMISPFVIAPMNVNRTRHT